MADLQGQGGWGVDIANPGHVVVADDNETTLRRIPDGVNGQVLTMDTTQPGKVSFKDVTAALDPTGVTAGTYGG